MVCLEDAHKMSLTAQKWETYRFTSKEWDEETGLYSFPARYYEPRLSRWMSADPAGFELINPMEKDDEGGLKVKENYSVIESTNWYSYVSNNPLKYVDPTGMQQIPGRERALYKVSDSVVSSWTSEWVSTRNEINTLENKISGLKSELSILKNMRDGLKSEATLKLSPSIVAGILEAANTGSAQTLAEAIPEAQYYIEKFWEILKRELEIPGEIKEIEAAIETKEAKADNLRRLIDGQAKLDLWLRKEEDE